ncbi:MAG: ABC transporter ATP-binding protein [Myxococcales bacterium]|nr:ABC transporter ATP-binding protein [Myxococcales bacterium]
MGLLAILVGAVVGLLPAYLVQHVLDAALGGQPDQLDGYVGAIFVVVVVQGLAGVITAVSLASLGERVLADARQHLFHRLLRWSLGQLQEQRAGETVSRFSDVAQVHTIVWCTLTLFENVAFSLAGLVYLWSIQAGLTSALLAMVPVLMASAVLFGRWNKRVMTEATDTYARAGGFLTEILGNIKLVQAHTREGYEEGRYLSHLEESRDQAVRLASAGALVGASSKLLMMVPLAILLWFGGHMVMDGALTAGQLTAFCMLALGVASRMEATIEKVRAIMQAEGALDRVFELMDRVPDVVERAGARELQAPRGEIEFDAVTHAYPNATDTPVLRGISFVARPGECIALVGPSGAGKTTILNLIPRFYDVIEGVVRVDGIDVRELRLADLRRAIGFVPQEPVLFSGTIYENIAYGGANVGPEAVERAARLADAHDFISRMPRAYQSHVGERGAGLSGGQRQRIAIARAIVDDPPILLLDEPTSSLDVASEHSIRQSLEQAMANRTSLLVTHRPSMARWADRVLVLQDGRVARDGTHEPLLESSEFYRMLQESEGSPNATSPLHVAVAPA